jgi:hypothetical protein
VCEASNYPWEKTRSGTPKGYCGLTQIEFDLVNMGDTGAFDKGDGENTSVSSMNLVLVAPEHKGSK